MANHIIVSLTFCFKGQSFSPSLSIDLDEIMQKEGSLPCFHALLAQKSGYDAYSHEYDVMMMAELEYEDIEGLVTEFIQDGQFDRDAFEAKWHQKNIHQIIQGIASRCMNIDDLAAHMSLQEALTEAYQLGLSTPDTSRHRNKGVTRDTTFAGF